MSILTWAGNRVFSARRNLESVFVAVLLVPVMPDLFVDWFGQPDNPARDGLLRLAAAAAVFVVAVLVGAARNAWTRHRAARSRAPFTPLPTADVLVLPISPRGTPYTRAAARAGNPEVPEYLCDHVRPTTVVAVLNPKTADRAHKLETELAADGITLVTVHLDDVHDPTATVAGTDKIIQRLRDLGAPPDRVLVDVTGGNVPLTLAMLRTAAVHGARCVYVATQPGPDGTPRPHTQQGHTFDPATLTTNP
ncbi:hypothetical protein ACFV4N_21895 [Actinosynnema sp. NPDC059797]